MSGVHLLTTGVVSKRAEVARRRIIEKNFFEGTDPATQVKGTNSPWEIAQGAQNFLVEVLLLSTKHGVTLSASLSSVKLRTAEPSSMSE